MEVRVCTGGGHRKRAGCSTGYGAGQASGCCMIGRRRLEYVVRVYECGCTDLGEDGQIYAVLLGWAALLSWHSIVPGWWSSRQQRCKDACRGSESCGEDCIRLCVLVHTECTRQNRFSATPTARPACCRCGRPGLSRAQEGQSKVFEDGKCVGSGGDCGKQRVIAASTLHLLLGHCNCLLLGCLWAQHLCYL